MQMTETTLLTAFPLGCPVLNLPMCEAENTDLRSLRTDCVGIDARPQT